jgi:hypothetical protein
VASPGISYVIRTFSLILPGMATDEKTAKNIIRDYYASFYPGLEHVYPQALKGQVEFVYNRLVKERRLEEYLQEYRKLAVQRKKKKGIPLG